MSFPFYIARRYTISRSKSTAVNIITRIAALGIFASTAALFIIMSAFSGLKIFSLSFINATDPDMTVTATLGKSFLISPEQEKQLKEVKDIATYSHIAEERVLFYFDGKEQVAYLKGIDSLYTDVNAMKQKLVYGQWLHPGTRQAVVGIGTSSKLSLGLFDFNHELEVYVPKPGKGTINTPDDAFNKALLIPIGIYSVNDDVDSKYVFCSLDMARDLLQFKPGQCTAIEIRLAKGASEDEVREKLKTIFNNKVTIQNRDELNVSLHKMLNGENLVTYLFCSLVVVMTLFCLAGALIMLILDKKENIRTLFSLGAEVKTLRNIFLYQGLFITVLGVASGLMVSIAVVFIQQKYSVVTLTGNLAYPVAFTFTNVFIVIATIFVLGFFASRIAAGRVNKKLLEN